MNDITKNLALTLGNSVAEVDNVLYRELSFQIVGAAIAVHRAIGPGKLESIYQRSLEKELAFRKIPFRAQAPVEQLYRGDVVGEFFADVIVDEKIVLELKSVSRVERVHRSQLLSYLHATGLRLGMLINFNVPILWHGVSRVVAW